MDTSLWTWPFNVSGKIFVAADVFGSQEKVIGVNLPS